MNTLEDSKFEQSNGRKIDFNGKEYALATQNKIIKDFFLKDSGAEMIESLHEMIESFLFTENLPRVTSEMRVHIVNQLRVATLIAKLNNSNSAVNRLSS